MTALMGDLDTRVIEKNVVKTPPVCDWNKNNPHYPACTNVAKWRVTLSCCGGVLLFCEEHMDMHLEAIAEGKLFSHGKPEGCGASWIQMPFASAERI